MTYFEEMQCFASLQSNAMLRRNAFKFTYHVLYVNLKVLFDLLLTIILNLVTDIQHQLYSYMCLIN